MVYYHCHLFGSKVSNIEEIECQNEKSAIALCREILTARPYYDVFELWHGGRRVHSENGTIPSLTKVALNR